MSWLKHHTRSEEYMIQAEEFARQQDRESAAKFYRLAAQAEESAIADLDPKKKRTLGITVVSAASLYYKAGEFALAKQISHHWLAEYWLVAELLPAFAIEELEEILGVIRYEESQRKSGIQFVEGEVLVSVSGGEIMFGAAPLELILSKVDQISKIFYRTTEFLFDQPLRKRGNPSQEIKNYCNPWLLQAPPGSYQFAVRVRRPSDQLTIPGLEDYGLRVEQITKKFLDIIRTTTQDPTGELVEVVPNEEYRQTFMKLTRNLAPPATGKTFDKLEIKAMSDIEPQPVILQPYTRNVIKDALQRPRLLTLEESQDQQVQLKGILRGLQLDNDWLEISIDGEDKNIKIYEADEIDDVIGPMVNRRVVVNVWERAKKPEDKKYAFQDIELEEDVEDVA